jgi:hypothetical protein
VTSPRYSEPGSFDRIREAAYMLGEVETDEAHDPDFHRADMRLRAAVNGYTREVLKRLLSWQRKGGKARWAGKGPEQRAEHARRMNQARWARRAPSKQGQER